MTSISRRNLTKGAAWASPVILATVVTPAYAASRFPTVTGFVDSLFYDSGTTTYQDHRMRLGVSSSSGIVPAGTTITWTINASGTTGNAAPTLFFSADTAWSLTISPSAGTKTTSTFVITLVTKADVAANTLTGGHIQVVWNNVYQLKPKTVLTTNSTTTGSKVNGLPSSLKYTVAKRMPATATDATRTAHIYTSRSGTQAFYPSILYSLNEGSTVNKCAASGVINNTSTINPNGTCQDLVIDSTQYGNQALVPASQ